MGPNGRWKGHRRLERTRSTRSTCSPRLVNKQWRYHSQRGLTVAALRSKHKQIDTQMIVRWPHEINGKELTDTHTWRRLILNQTSKVTSQLLSLIRLDTDLASSAHISPLLTNFSICFCCFIDTKCVHRFCLPLIDWDQKIKIHLAACWNKAFQHNLILLI